MLSILRRGKRTSKGRLLKVPSFLKSYWLLLACFLIFFARFLLQEEEEHEHSAGCFCSHHLQQFVTDRQSLLKNPISRSEIIQTEVLLDRIFKHFPEADAQKRPQLLLRLILNEKKVFEGLARRVYWTLRRSGDKQKIMERASLLGPDTNQTNPSQQRCTALKTLKNVLKESVILSKREWNRHRTLLSSQSHWYLRSALPSPNPAQI